MPASTTYITGGLIAWYKFEEGVGTTAIDSTGNGHTGTLTNSPIYVNGKVGHYALLFNGANNVNIGTYNPFPNGTGSFCFWVNLNTASIAANNYCLAKGNDAGTVSWGLDIIPDGAGNATVAFLYGAATWVQIASTPFSLNVWHNVAVNMNNNAQQVFVDGTSIVSGTKTNITPSAAAGLNIAKTDRVAPFQYFTNGTMDDVRLYSRSLSTTEITRIATLQG